MKHAAIRAVLGSLPVQLAVPFMLMFSASYVLLKHPSVAVEASALDEPETTASLGPPLRPSLRPID